jgi:hypothetical protein
MDELALNQPDPMKAIARVAELRHEIVELETKLEAARAKLRDLSPWVLSYFSEVGLDKVTLNGLTMYPRRELWSRVADGKSADDVAEALADAGYPAHQIAAIVKLAVNSNTLSALMREYDARAEEPPPALAAAVSTTEVFKLGFRAS